MRTSEGAKCLLANPWLRGGLLILAVLVAGVLVLRPAGRVSTAGWAAVVDGIVKSAAAAPGTTDVSGGYLPGQGLVFMASVRGVQLLGLNQWLLPIVGPAAGRLTGLGRNETIIWQVNATGTTSGDFRALINIPRRAAADPRRWVMSAASSGRGATGAPAASGVPAASDAPAVTPRASGPAVTVR